MTGADAEVAVTPPPVAPLTVADPVREAVAAGRPVVALESTLIAHGLPRPRNLAVALELEELLRAAGVVPATVGLVAGRPVVGLTPDELDLLATRDGVAKASVRDLGPAVALGRHAATTVAATAHLAALAGIRVFATGGIGGVHREAATTFDESADLPTLAATPITVVAAGVKSILDVPATLERLETLGVGLLGYRTDRFPGFYVADSGHPLDWTVSGPEEVAAVMAARDALGVRAGLLVANPVPVDRQLDPDLHRAALAEALAAAAAGGIQGKAVSPFLLEHVRRVTGGASLEANVALVRHNVTVAADIARAWADRPR